MLSMCMCWPWSGDLLAEQPLSIMGQLLQDNFIISSSKIKVVLEMELKGGCSNLSFLNVSSIFTGTVKYYQLEN